MLRCVRFSAIWVLAVASLGTLMIPACSHRELPDGHGATAAGDGSDAALSPRAPAADHGVTTTREGGSSGGPEADVLTGAPSASDQVHVQTLDSAPPESIRYAIPEGWSATQASGLRRVSFEIREGALTAEATAIGLPGSATRLLPNFNLWRRQVGLPDATQEELDAALEALEVGGRPGHYIRLVGPPDATRPRALLVVLAGQQDPTWLFTLSGDMELVLHEEEHFKAFVRSVTFVPASGDKND
jgi:hypothetical protein